MILKYNKNFQLHQTCKSWKQKYMKSRMKRLHLNKYFSIFIIFFLKFWWYYKITAHNRENILFLLLFFRVRRCRFVELKTFQTCVEKCARNCFISSLLFWCVIFNCKKLYILGKNYHYFFLMLKLESQIVWVSFNDSITEIMMVRLLVRDQLVYQFLNAPF
jgi:hypothetical protein